MTILPSRTGFALLRAFVLTLTAVTILAAHALAGPYEDARALYRRGDYRGALRQLEQARRADPNDPRPFLLAGSTYAKMGDERRARSAWNRYVQLDPDLSRIPNEKGRDEFRRALAQVGGSAAGGGVAAPAGDGGAGRGGSRSSADASPIIKALTSGNVYVQPDLKGEVDAGRLDAVARETGAKIAVVDRLGSTQQRARLARSLSEALNVGDRGFVLVGTPEGVSASSGRKLGQDQIERALRGANLNQAQARGGLTEVLVTAAQASGKAIRSDRTADNGSVGGLLFLGAAGAGGFALYRSAKKRREMDAVRRPVEQKRKAALDNLSYVDGYLDLLPAGEDATRARALRQEAYDNYARAAALLQGAQNRDDVHRAEPLLDDALVQLEQCRAAIDKATGGTGVAMSIPELPSLATDDERAAADRLKPIEQVRSEQEARRLQAEIEQIPPDQRGVSFFSGQPLPASELVPVTMVIGGQKRTVMVSRDEAAAIQRGETPQVRAFEQDGRYVPWYENRGYDPYRDYYGGWGGGGFGGMGTFVNLFMLSQLFGGGLFGGYGGWGFGGMGYGGPTVINNNYGGGAGDAGGGGFFGGGDFGGAVDNAPVENTGSFDLFGQGGTDDFGGGNLDFGGGDFGGGGGDFGGGDFGGGD